MLLGQLVLQRVFARPHFTHATHRHRRRSARSALGYGFAAFVLTAVVLSVVLDSSRPEWRDPEFGHRLNQIRKWKVDAPQRPLILIAGSSRVQMGISPKAMAFADEPGSPLAYNLGYRQASPSASALHVLRVIDAGETPAAVLIEFCPAALLSWGGPESVPNTWPNRLSYSDLRRLRELGANGDVTPVSPWTRSVWATSMAPWSRCRLTMLSHILPEWVLPGQERNLETERMDEFGFQSCPFSDPTPEQRRSALDVSRKTYEKLFNRTQINPAVDFALAALVARCRALDVPIAFFRIPESVTFRSWFTPASIAAGNAYADHLTQTHGVPIFPSPELLVETDFADGYHLVQHGAERYSRWLADTHLRPWLASQGISGK